MTTQYVEGNLRIGIDLHSVNPVGEEVITWDLSYERMIHAEFMTHRWGRNASSSRAIPYNRMKDWIFKDPALPVHLGRNQKGMQAGNAIDDRDGCYADLKALLETVSGACDVFMGKYDLHKEIINRYTEPWGWINVVASMGRAQLMNYFSLRVNPYANPNMQRLAVWMARLYRASQPQKLKEGQWHLPFLYPEERVWMPEDTAIKWSVARSAWASYRTVDGKAGTWEDAKRRHDDCVSLKHVTPCEHQYRARNDSGRNGGMVPGYDQYRHMIEGESVKEFDFSILDTVYKDRDFVILT